MREDYMTSEQAKANLRHIGASLFVGSIAFLAAYITGIEPFKTLQVGFWTFIIFWLVKPILAYIIWG